MKLVKESLDFQRGQGVKKTLKVGSKHKEESVKYFLNTVNKFDSLIRGHPDYWGWTEIHEGDFEDEPEFEEGFKYFVEDYEKYLDYMAHELDLYLRYEPPNFAVPTMEETMFVRED